ncbi:MAG TPA: sulfatase [Tepidisphaeraceae bacterium]|nr:sulfatase [Tepidisphaeraceae bacterium]
MTRILSALIAIFWLATPLLAAGKKLNVLLIISDDLCADLGCYGAPVITPNIDALAKQGVRMDRMYCQYPMCGPSRCSFMSGLTPDTDGIYVNGLTVRYKLKDVVTLPQFFRENGYYSARSGKIYHLGIPNQVGTPGPDDPASWDYAFNPKGNEFPTLDDGDQYDPEPKNDQGFRRNRLKDDEGKTQADYEIASEAIRLMDEHREKPFFLAVGFIRPHVPEIAPKKYFDLYDISKIKLPDNPANDRDDIPIAAFHYKAPDRGMSQQDCLESKRAYYATTSFMDHQAGRVLDELDRLGLRDSTIVVFMSDHGYLLGQHFAWQKMLLFEEACRVPMIVSYPDMQNRGTTTAGITELIDLFPTVCDLAGLKGPGALEGKSFRDLLEHPEHPFKDVAYSMLTRKEANGRSIRTDRYRYTEWADGTKGVELYDHATDPHEYTNLAKDPGHAEIMANLQRILRAHLPATMPALPARSAE